MTASSFYTQGPDGMVELVPNSEVYIPALTMHTINTEQFPRGSKLVRKLVHAIFSDDELAVSSCLGSGVSQKGLDRQKLEAIKGGCTALAWIVSIEKKACLVCSCVVRKWLILCGLYTVVSAHRNEPGLLPIYFLRKMFRPMCSYTNFIIFMVVDIHFVFTGTL